MARTVTQIYNEILTEKAKYSSLDGLSNTSNASIWRSIYYVVAVAIATAEQLRDLFQTELLEVAETLPTGTPKWYAQTLLDYQEGYNLEYNRTNGKLEYSVIDEEAKIIKVATCESESDTVVLKCAKDNGAHGLEELSGPEYLSVLAYINDYKFAGTVVSLISSPPDYLRIKLNVKVNASIINSLGQSTSNITVYPVEDAINDYIKEYGNTNFNSTFKLIDLIDTIQLVAGVTNVVVTEAYGKPVNGTEYIGILSTQLNTYKAEAGYLQIDPSYPLNSNITYIV